ncbi:hypothetical protein E5D57_010677 [Metarhizium anisopliae]|nr:hypothetical protein E5D57_010677 [Metarhizium anisopliae]
MAVAVAVAVAMADGATNQSHVHRLLVPPPFDDISAPPATAVVVMLPGPRYMTTITAIEWDQTP